MSAEAATVTPARGRAAEVGKPCLSAKNISKSFHASGQVVKNVSFTLPEGQSLALIGSNGSGKSTLLRCSLRLLEPSEGQSELFGRALQDLSARQLRRIRSQVGFVFQYHNLVKRLSVLTNVIHGAFARTGSPRIWFQSLASREHREEALYCLERVGLAQFAHKRVDELSGGQSQRVSIARALMQRPQLIVADEPVASLDPKAGKEVMDLFASLTNDEDLTIVFSTHHLEHALGYAERIVALKQGELVLDTLSSETDIATLRRLYE